MSVDSFLQNLPFELWQMIVTADFSSLATLRQVNGYLWRNKHLLKIFKSLESHQRLEKAVFAAPFFPREMMNRSKSDELNEFSHGSKRIYFANNEIGYFSFQERSSMRFFWLCQIYLPKKWTNFFWNHGEDASISYLQQHFRSTNVNPSVSEDDYCVNLHWYSFNLNIRPYRAKENCTEYRKHIAELKYVNLAKVETQFWAIYKIVNSRSPTDFFASDQMFF